MNDAKQEVRSRLSPRTFAAVPAQAMNDDRLKSREWRVLVCISWHANANGLAWPSQDLIADETGLNRSTVNRAVTRLAKLGYLVPEKRKRRHGHWPANTYKVVRVKPMDPNNSPKPNDHGEHMVRVTTVSTNRVTAVSTLTGQRTEGYSEHANVSASKTVPVS